MNTSHKPFVFVSARMSSVRLPGKMLMEFGGQPLLSHVVEAVSAAKGLTRVVVVTSSDVSDDPIARWCDMNNVDSWRGDLADVAGRMLAAAEHLGAEAFVRVSGDSPMIDPRLVSFAAQRFAGLNYDLVTNVSPRTFPPGQSVEVVRTETLERFFSSGKSDPKDREHVTPILYRLEGEVRIARFAPADVQPHGKPPVGPYKSMTVDTPEDAACFRQVIRSLGDVNVWTHGWEQCEALMRAADQHIRDGSGAWNA